jgi:hypothetical protein
MFESEHEVTPKLIDEMKSKYASLYNKTSENEFMDVFRFKSSLKIFGAQHAAIKADITKTLDTIKKLKLPETWENKEDLILNKADLQVLDVKKDSGEWANIERRFNATMMGSKILKI